MSLKIVIEEWILTHLYDLFLKKKYFYLTKNYAPYTTPGESRQKVWRSRLQRMVESIFSASDTGEIYN